MPRTRCLAVAAGFAILLIFGAAFAAEIRAAIATAFPGQARTIIGGTVVALIGAALLLAANRIRTVQRGDGALGDVRERRTLRYLALVAALAVGALFARGLRTGDADTDAVELFHFVEYGLLTLLFYRV